VAGHLICIKMHVSCASVILASNVPALKNRSCKSVTYPVGINSLIPRPFLNGLGMRLCQHVMERMAIVWPQTLNQSEGSRLAMDLMIDFSPSLHTHMVG